MKYEYETTRLVFKSDNMINGGHSKLILPDKSGQWRLAHVTDSTAFWEKEIVGTPENIFGKPSDM